MDIFQIIFLLFVFFILWVMLVWMPGDFKQSFNLSFWKVNAISSKEFSIQLLKTLEEQGFRPQQSYYELPSTQCLLVDGNSRRILIDASYWDAPLNGKQLFHVEQTRLKTCADESWILKPEPQGAWVGWLAKARLGHIKFKNISQIMQWIEQEKQRKGPICA
jgi:hypothetical protein